MDILQPQREETYKKIEWWHLSSSVSQKAHFLCQNQKDLKGLEWRKILIHRL